MTAARRSEAWIWRHLLTALITFVFTMVIGYLTVVRDMVGRTELRQYVTTASHEAEINYQKNQNSAQREATNANTAAIADLVRAVGALQIQNGVLVTKIEALTDALRGKEMK